MKMFKFNFKKTICTKYYTFRDLIDVLIYDKLKLQIFASELLKPF